MKAEGGFAVAEKVSDRAVRLAGIEHDGRSVMAQVLKLESRSSPRRSPAVAQYIRPHRHRSIDASREDVLRSPRLRPAQFAPAHLLTPEDVHSCGCQRDVPPIGALRGL